MKKARIIDELLASQLFGEHLSLEPIKGGVVNLSYRLATQSGVYFLKTFELNHITPTDRQALFFQQQQLSELGITSMPIYLSKAHDFQVESWVEHISLLKVNKPQNDKIQILAKVLSEIHALPTLATSIDLPKDWIIYLKAATVSDVDYWQQRIIDCKPSWIETHKSDQVLCHNDLAMEHVAMQEPAFVFDWEYASLGNRYFDLASCALINNMDYHEMMTLQHSYAQFCELSEHYVFEQFQTQFPIVQLTYDLWKEAAKAILLDDENS
ncbi:phosphotransferase [Aliiglaciecola sp. 3_MG-2023]|uniref:phosphotransferase n=1 Tax=Aliiglaciecola sp. 3_MG-2023 TaxID=3062644 RepID=UPI0026E3308C|nr:phosphotransferase [Aliiglaciecola sp. 3_MG-2023]MDO6695773.1 phosphotransferase [Aliiglaciecola sp. 3_MG-2023]